MAYSPEQLEHIRNQLHTSHLAGKIIAHDELESTNDLAKKLLAEGAEEGTVVLADAQTCGRGRLGREWYSEKGAGLYFSVILKPPMAADQYPHLTLMAAVATVTAINQLSPGRASLKWPNDILLNHRKLGGILSEHVVDGAHTGAILGIGLNISQNRFPEGLQTIATSLLIENQTHPERHELLPFIINNLDGEYQNLLEVGMGPLRERWRQNSAMLGAHILLTQGAETYSGVAEDLDDSGRLVVLLDSGEQKAFEGGEVTLRE